MRAWMLTATLLLSFCTTAQAASSNTSVFYPAVVRDFNVEHVEFERYTGGRECGTVEDELGDDRKPILHGGITVTGKYLDGPCSFGGSGGAKRAEYFQNFYRDVPGQTIRYPVLLELEEDPPGSGTYRFDRRGSSPFINQFFPIDGQGWGHDIRRTGATRNFLFTAEVHATFIFRGTEIFNFAGDDDVYVFVDRKLVVDVGGIHAEEPGSVSLANVASRLGLVVGQRYDFDFFIAERHWSQSNAQIVTTLAPVNERPLTQPSSYVVGVGQSVTLEFVSFDPDRDVVVYELFPPSDILPFLTLNSGDNSSALFTAPTSLDAYIGVNDTEYTFTMDFSVSDAEFTACPSTVSVTVTRVLLPPPPPPAPVAPPAATPPPPDNTETIIIASVAGALALIALVGLIALVLFIRSQTATWKMEVLQQLNQETLAVNPLYVAEENDVVNPLYDANTGGGGESFF